MNTSRRMNAGYMARGMFILVLGAVIMVFGLAWGILANGAFGFNATTASEAPSWGLVLSIVGAVLAIIGGAVLAHGISAKEPSGISHQPAQS